MMRNGELLCDERYIVQRIEDNCRRRTGLTNIIDSLRSQRCLQSDSPLDDLSHLRRGHLQHTPRHPHVECAATNDTVDSCDSCHLSTVDVSYFCGESARGCPITLSQSPNEAIHRVYVIASAPKLKVIYRRRRGCERGQEAPEMDMSRLRLSCSRCMNDGRHATTGSLDRKRALCLFKLFVRGGSTRKGERPKTSVRRDFICGGGIGNMLGANKVEVR
ncbi:hypothetical protein GEV33_013134 [Tenebrio molitor]|uniref:Uncharacterized protein n=1 Tax=Tenebrio molitor TaxID=7067 RepID=A0A8J6H927_TENMO|nr:hypothetical protein GEV33_013134 [Tenebrio molitor]